MIEVLIIQETGWTHEEYLRQPWWIVEGILIKLREDATHAKRSAQLPPRG